jgi:uncharacterized protein (TIGR00369 family)
VAGPEDASVDDVNDLFRRVPGHVLSLFQHRDVDEPGADMAIEVDLRPEIENTHGSLQGGLAATLADMVAGRAVVARLASSGRRTATLDLHMRYLTTTRVGPVRAVARIVRFGSTIAVVNVDLFDMGADRRHVSTGTLSFFLLESPLDGRPSVASDNA